MIGKLYALVMGVCAGAFQTAFAEPPQCFPRAEVLIESNVVDAALDDLDADSLEDVFALRPPLVEVLKNAGGHYVASTVIEVGGNPSRIETARISTDDIPDLILLRGSEVLSYVNFTGDYPPTPSNTFSLPAAALELAVADFDNDGDDDAAVTLPTLGQVIVLYYDATGAVDHAATIDVGGEPQDIATGDVNGDGLIDLAVQKSSQTKVSVAFNRGEKGFAPLAVEFDEQVKALAAADVTGDGRADLCCIVQNKRTSVRIRVSMGAEFLPSMTIALANQSIDTYQILPSDLDDDGDIDLWAVFGDVVSHPWQQLSNDGGGNFTVGPAIGTLPAQKIMETDTDGDGQRDLLSLTTGGNRLMLTRDDNKGGFAETYAGWMEGLGLSAEPADINNDGIDDLLGAADGSVVVRWGGPRHTVIFDVLYKSVGLTHPIAADLTNDGLVDIYAAGSEPKVLIQQPDGTFVAIEQELPASVDAAFGDFNNDGYLDVVSKSNSSLILAVLINDGSGRMTLAELDGTGVWDLTSGDLNRDGFDDIAIGGEISVPHDPFEWPWRIFATRMNNKLDGFAPAVWIGEHETGTECALNDWDGDGDLDAAVGYQGFQCRCAFVILFRNDGDGNFTEADRPAGNVCCIAAYGVTMGDIDQDGRVDLITGGDGVWTSHALGNGTFEPWDVFAYYQYGIRTPRLGDYDGDGRIDLSFVPVNFQRPSILHIAYGSCGRICRGDVDRNRRVDVRDLFRLLSDWGPCPNCDADLDRDGIVGREDLMNLLMSWGNCEN